MRRVLLIGALVVSFVALTAVMPSSSTAWFGRWGTSAMEATQGTQAMEAVA